jgi:hypothetical protein
MTVEEQIERLAGIVNGLASAAVAHGEPIEAHDRQLGALLKIVEQLGVQVAATERQRQAYINTLPRQ